MKQPILELEHVSYVYSPGTPFEKKALDDVSLTLEKGDFTALIGHTGSGKSTLIQHMNGLLRPTKGTVRLDGKDLFAGDIRKARFRVGLVFQYAEYQLFAETVGEDIAFGPSNMGLEQDEITQRVRQAMHDVGLPRECENQSPFELSGGQKRRAAIAGVLAMQPDVLILDEPAAGLDPQGREEMYALIRRLHDNRGTTVLLVTHSMEDAARIANRLVVMKDGQIFLSGTPEDVFEQTDAMERAGLAVPQITQVMRELRRRGLDVDASCYTISQAAAELLAYAGGNRNAP